MNKLLKVLIIVFAVIAIFSIILLVWAYSISKSDIIAHTGPQNPKDIPTKVYATIDNIQGQLEYMSYSKGFNAPADEMCPDGNSVGKLWLDLSIDKEGVNVEYVCDIQSLNSDTQTSGLDWYLNQQNGFHANYGLDSVAKLKQKQAVRVCCKDVGYNPQQDLCKTFTLEPYC